MSDSAAQTTPTVRNFLLTRPWSTRRLRYVLEYLAFRSGMAALRILPMERAADITAVLCRFFSSRGFRQGRALANLARAFPEKSTEEHEAIALAMWENIGRVIAEAAHLDTFIAEPQRLELVDSRTLDEYASQRGLYLIVGLHTGNWEIGLLHTSRRGFEPAAFYRAIANPLVDAYVKASRQTIYNGGLFVVRGETGSGSNPDMRSRQIVNVLRKGGPIGILMDHYDPTGIVVPFFGHGVRVSRAAATLALQFGARLCVARTIRVGRRSRFIGEAVEIALPATGDRQADISAATAMIMARFETWIRQFPEQWLWTQAPFVAGDGSMLCTPLDGDVLPVGLPRANA